MKKRRRKREKKEKKLRKGDEPKALKLTDY